MSQYLFPIPTPLPPLDTSYLMVSMLYLRSSGLGSSPGHGHCACSFLGKTLQGRDTRCDKSRRHVTATSRLIYTVAATRRLPLFCRCDMSHEFKPVWIRATDRSDNDFHMSHEAICCSNLLWRRVAAICRIVCFGLYSHSTSLHQVYKWMVANIMCDNPSIDFIQISTLEDRRRVETLLLRSIHETKERCQTDGSLGSNYAPFTNSVQSTCACRWKCDQLV